MTKNSAVQIGYCTNVHAGADWPSAQNNLQRHALAVKSKYSPDQPLGVGLWLAAEAAHSLHQDPQRLKQAAEWLQQSQLSPFTFNGFPYGDFHQEVVKHQVYLPTWKGAARREYTRELIDIQNAMLPAGVEGSISTLPLCWGNPQPTSEELDQAAAELLEIADYLARVEQEHGRLIHVCLEPEPGCALQRSEDIVRFFENHLLRKNDSPHVLRHLRVCHDICHAAVMFEEQADVLDRFQAAGILVGKVQVSAAVIAAWEEIEPEQRTAAFKQLGSFAEDRYLHQTCVRAEAGGPIEFHEDLPALLASVDDPQKLSGQWRVHFHVPIYLQRFGHLQASQTQILECLQALQKTPEMTHYEVETYAWGVLPQELQQPELAAGIAEEMAWLRRQLDEEA